MKTSHSTHKMLCKYSAWMEGNIITGLPKLPCTTFSMANNWFTEPFHNLLRDCKFIEAGEMRKYIYINLN